MCTYWSYHLRFLCLLWHLFIKEHLWLERSRATDIWMVQRITVWFSAKLDAIPKFCVSLVVHNLKGMKQHKPPRCSKT